MARVGLSVYFPFTQRPMTGQCTDSEYEAEGVYAEVEWKIWSKAVVIDASREIMSSTHNRTGGQRLRDCNSVHQVCIGLRQTKSLL